MLTSRRNQLIAAVIAVIVVAGIVFWLKPGLFPGGQVAETGTLQERLLKPGQLDEMTLGDPNAPITVIEYASATCIHCANFAVNIFPEFKEKYIDTGKVYFIFREFPFDPLATGAFMLARCTGDRDKYFAFVDLLFHQHRNWTQAPDPVNALFDLSKQAGFTAESFDSCLSNRQLQDRINQVKDRAETVFDVNSTPTFFVNGQIARGVQTIEDFEKLFAAGS